jgi:hypothetical protein
MARLIDWRTGLKPDQQRNRFSQPLDFLKVYRSGWQLDLVRSMRLDSAIHQSYPRLRSMIYGFLSFHKYDP